MKNKIQPLSALSLSEKQVLLRVDFNVPIQNGTIQDTSRIRAVLPTLQMLHEKNAKTILISHLGRPKGKIEPKYSLAPIGEALSDMLHQPVLFTQDPLFSEGMQTLIQNLKGGSFLLLENIRFYPGETKNTPAFCHKLALLGDVYLNDAFGSCHRKHASVYGVPLLFSHEKGMGLLVEKELKALSALLNPSERPFYILLGGAKVSDKLPTLEALFRKADGFFIGGKMAFAFLKSSDASTYLTNISAPKEEILAAKRLLHIAKQRDVPVYLPIDMVETYDIGPQTRKLFSEKLLSGRTFFWNGPLGWFEKPPFHEGTFEIAEVLAQHCHGHKVIGGGDTVSAIKASHQASGFTHLSTGGGATLSFLANTNLPGLEALKVAKQETLNTQD